MINNLYSIVVVLIRLLAVWLIGSALYAFLATFIAGLVVGGAAQNFSVLALAIAVVAGIVLWILAKPVARAVTSGVE